MAQKLIMPINNSKFRIGRNSAGFTRYIRLTQGVTITNSVSYTLSHQTDASGITVYASGNGTVIASGDDSNFGKVIVIKYPSCELPSGAIKDIIVRYFHLGSISTNAAAGKTVTKDTVIGTTGRTGRYCPETYGRIRVEVDTDTQYPTYSGSVMSGWTNSIIKRGTDSTTLSLNQVMFIKNSSPDNQTMIIGPENYLDTTTNSNYAWFGASELGFTTTK